MANGNHIKIINSGKPMKVRAPIYQGPKMKFNVLVGKSLSRGVMNWESSRSYDCKISLVLERLDGDTDGKFDMNPSLPSAGGRKVFRPVRR